MVSLHFNLEEPAPRIVVARVRRENGSDDTGRPLEINAVGGFPHLLQKCSGKLVL